MKENSENTLFATQGFPNLIRYSGRTLELVIKVEERISGLDICQSKGQWIDRCFDC